MAALRGSSWIYVLFKSIPLDEEYLVAGQGDSSEETEVFSVLVWKIKSVWIHWK